MTAAGPDHARPLPAWRPADLAAALAPGPVALLDGLTREGRSCTLVAWAPAALAGSVDEARAAAEALGRPGAAPPLLGAAIGAIDWDGRGRFWVPGGAALFDWTAQQLWVRGALPEVPAPAPAVTPHAARPMAEAPSRATVGWSKTGYCTAVQEARRRMGCGELEKVVLSIPFTAPCPRPPLTVWRNLTQGDPPGLRFLLDDGRPQDDGHLQDDGHPQDDGRPSDPGAAAGALLGVSPEPLVLLTGRRAELHLLAGTRPDAAGQAEDLLQSPKDWWEHGVAVEQARRDLETVCEIGSVTVDGYMQVERHPGLIHLASHLSGILREGATPGELVAACFPAGTVGGVPRQPAIALIGELEPRPRVWYAGAVGAVLPTGDLQLWLTIRSLRLAGGVGHVQTGAGLVPESQPEAEWQECINKARRALAALGVEVNLDEF